MNALRALANSVLGRRGGAIQEASRVKLTADWLASLAQVQEPTVHVWGKQYVLYDDKAGYILILELSPV